jgi:hypothetical protein
LEREKLENEDFGSDKMSFVKQKIGRKEYIVPDEKEILKAIKSVAPQYYDRALENYQKKLESEKK